MNYVGKNFPIHDAVAKATGRLRYAGDMELQGMLHMALVFSTIPHGIVKNIDYSEALALPGVVDIVDYSNTTDKHYNRYHTQFRQDLVENENIFNKHVRFVGDRIAGVIAKTEEIARKAAKLVKVTYEEYPYSLSMEETLSGKIDNVYDEGAVYGEYENVTGTRPDDNGLVDIKAVTNLSRISHLCMETHVCIADYDKSNGELSVYSPSQAVFGIRSLLGDLFEMDYSKIRVLKTTMGGSFGGKQEWILEPTAAAAAIKVGRPVRLVFNRSETIASAYSRAPMHFETDFKFTKEGKLQTVDCDMSLDAGAYVGNSVNYARTVNFKMFRVYSYPFCKYTTRAIITNTIVSGAFRGWTGPEFTIMFEHSMNLAAKKLGIDPIDLRLLNVATEGTIDPLSGVSLGAIRLKEAMEKGRKEFEWDKKKEEVKAFNAQSKRFKRGLGVSFGGHVNNFYPGKPEFTRVTMSLTESGSVICNLTLHDHGCGTVTAMKMVAGEELGIDPSMVKIGEGDTNYTPWDVGCFSSRTAYVQGQAIVKCAKEFKNKIIEFTSEYTGKNTDDLYIEDAIVLSKTDKDFKYTWSDVADFGVQKLRREVFVSYEHRPDSNPGVGGAHFALTEVDTYTGMVKILDYMAVHDIGKAINREMCVAQIQGAVVMGAGAALTEHISINKNGVSKSSIKDYHVINSFEAPNVKVGFIEDGDTDGPYGAKSIGEVALTPVAPTIVASVNDALQSEMNSLPLTPDVIVNYLSSKEAK